MFPFLAPGKTLAGLPVAFIASRLRRTRSGFDSPAGVLTPARNLLELRGLNTPTYAPLNLLLRIAKHAFQQHVVRARSLQNLPTIQDFLPRPTHQRGTLGRQRSLPNQHAPQFRLHVIELVCVYSKFASYIARHCVHPVLNSVNRIAGSTRGLSGYEAFPLPHVLMLRDAVSERTNHRWRLNFPAAYGSRLSCCVRYYPCPSKPWHAH